MIRSPRVRRFLDAHDVVGAAAYLASSSAVVAVLLAGLVLIAPTTVPADLLALVKGMAAAMAGLAGVAAVAWVVASMDRQAATEDLVDEIHAYLDATHR